MVGAGTNLYYTQTNALTNVAGGLQSGALMSFTTFVDRLFFCNGYNFMKWQAGATPYLFSLPRLEQPAGLMDPGFVVPTGNTNLNWANATLTLSWAFVNDRGYLGYPALSHFSNGAFTTKDPSGVPRDTILFSRSAPRAIGGATYQGFFYDESNQLYASFGIGFTVGMTFVEPIYGTLLSSTLMFAGAAIFRDTGPGTERFLVKYLPVLSVGGFTFIAESQSATAVFSLGPFDILRDPEPKTFYFTLMPKYLEIFNNQLFMSGFTTAPSTAYFSDIGDPETITSDNNFEVRTNDGDRITGMKQYLNQLVMFKERSFHVLSGDNPDNFSIRQISDQYGCISGRAIVQFENRFLFLDKKGVCEYNGVNVSIISNNVEPIFSSMNLTAAKDNAVMIHNKFRNQVWLAIPTNGSTLNNTTIVYDYILNAWTKFEGFVPSVLATANANFSEPRAIYGSYSGMVFNFGSSYFGDNGSGITALIKTRFIADSGNSTQKQFRRAWINFDPVSGSTGILNVNFMQDYGSSFVYSTTLSLSDFQTRLDFGISAKSLSIQISQFSAVDSLRLHGFSIAHRYQREV